MQLTLWSLRGAAEHGRHPPHERGLAASCGRRAASSAMHARVHSAVTATLLLQLDLCVLLRPWVTPESAARPMTTTCSPGAASARTTKVAADRRWAVSAGVRRLKTAWVCGQQGAATFSVMLFRTTCSSCASRWTVILAGHSQLHPAVLHPEKHAMHAAAPGAPGRMSCRRTGSEARPARPAPCSTQ